MIVKILLHLVLPLYTMPFSFFPLSLLFFVLNCIYLCCLQTNEASMMRALELSKSKSGVYNPSQEVKSPQLSYTQLISVETSSFPTIKKKREKLSDMFTNNNKVQSAQCYFLLCTLCTTKRLKVI